VSFARPADRSVAPGSGAPEPGWTVVLPLKGGPAAKSRLGGPPGLAGAIARDCLDAVLACPVVDRALVVTADLPTVVEARSAGAEPVRETRPGAGLNAAVLDGLAAATFPGPVAVLLGDLPALRPGDLTDGLAAVLFALDTHPTAPAAAVPDAEGEGTVLLAGRSAADLRGLGPAFGPGSMAEHRRRGAVPVEPDAPRLRRDVDTRRDLDAALVLGVGPRTARLAGVPAVG
jgi:2-phospho-L-lactate guanylyltransferase